MKNIIIRLEEDVLKFYEDFAVKTNRSRKKEIEILVSSYALNKLMEENPGIKSKPLSRIDQMKKLSK